MNTTRWSAATAAVLQLLTAVLGIAAAFGIVLPSDKVDALNASVGQLMGALMVLSAVLPDLIGSLRNAFTRGTCPAPLPEPYDGTPGQHGRAHPLLLGVLALVLAACTSLQAPRNLTDSLAYTQTSITAARDTAAALLQRDRISVATARTVQARADDAQQALRTARLLAQSGDQAGARDRLAVATSILLEIEASLKGAQP